jgi:hypothetical protein
MRVSVVATGIDAQAYVNPIPSVEEKVTVRACTYYASSACF